MKNLKKYDEFMLGYIDIIKELKIEKYFSILIKYNKSNIAPYHNINHALVFMKNAYIISNVEKLEESEKRLLCISALFHDFNHSLGKKDDSENIKEAIKIVDKYVEDEIKDIIKHNIKATQYPYVIEDSDLTFLQKIMRDCDMMQTTEDNYISQVLFGLSNELNIEFVDFLDIQLKFLDNIVLYTEYAKTKMDNKLSKIKSEVEFLKKILKDV